MSACPTCRRGLPPRWPEEKRDRITRAQGLSDRVADLRAWAIERIEQCRREERKFGANNIAIEAASERRALQAVLRILDAVTGAGG